MKTVPSWSVKIKAWLLFSAQAKAAMRPSIRSVCQIQRSLFMKNRSVLSLREVLRRTNGMTSTRKEDICSRRMPPRSVLRPHAQTNHGCCSVVSMPLAVSFLLLGPWPLGRKTVCERAGLPTRLKQQLMCTFAPSLVLIGLGSVREVLGALLSLDF